MRHKEDRGLHVGHLWGRQREWRRAFERNGAWEETTQAEMQCVLRLEMSCDLITEGLD